VLVTISDHTNEGRIVNRLIVKCFESKATMPEAEVESELKPEQQGGSSISSSVPSALILHSLLHELPTNPRPLVGQPLPALVPHLKMADSHQKETGPIQYNTFLNTSYKNQEK
jgi:hypothetical protein